MAEETLFRWPLDEFEDRFGQTAFKQLWESGDFKVAGVPQATFRLLFYPKGDNEKTKDSCALYLRVRDFAGHSFVYLSFALWIENAEKQMLKKSKCTQKFHLAEKSWGWQAFVGQQELAEFARNGPLFVCASIRPRDPIEPIEWAKRSAPLGVCRKIAATFDSDHFADTEVHVQGNVFKALTRMIICAGSPVFRAMFTDDTKEKTSGVVVIENGDADMIELLLRFLYSGQVKGLAEVAPRLLPVADCYEVHELAELCMESLASKLSVGTVLRDLQLTFAHDHSGDFKQKVLEFARKNFQLVRQQADWTPDFLRENVDVVDALFEVLTPQ